MSYRVGLDDVKHLTGRVDTMMRRLWTPFEGMQVKALAATEFEVLLGGAKGPGKSDVILAGATRQAHMPRYKALILRETGPQLSELIERSHRMFTRLPSKPQWRGDLRRWKFPGDTTTGADGGSIWFEAVSTVEDVERVQGKEWPYIGYDELGNLRDEKVWELLMAECRSPNPKIVRMMRGSANPGKSGHAWIKRRFITKCGVDGRRVVIVTLRLPNGQVAKMARRFIPGTVIDNPIYANDPMYMMQLYTLPEVLRRQLLFGDWDAGYGAALGELDERVHFIKSFAVPDRWVRFGAFDWGFAHLWVFIEFAVQEDGRVYVLQTLRGRRHLPNVIAEKIKHKVNIHRPSYMYTHTDSAAFQDHKSRSDATPTVDQELLKYDIVLSSGNTGRHAGLNNLRHYIAWRGIGPGGEDMEPGVRFVDNPGNRWLFDQLQSMVIDEDDMEDVLKVNANADTGEGGDDGYDCFRVGMASRPPRAIGQFWKGDVQAFSKQTLAHMVEQLYRDNPAEADEALRRGSLFTQYGGQ